MQVLPIKSAAVIINFMHLALSYSRMHDCASLVPIDPLHRHGEEAVFIRARAVVSILGTTACVRGFSL